MANEEPPKRAPQPRLPDFFYIPPQLMDQWAAIPIDEVVAPSLTRRDIDNLILGLLRTLESQFSLDRAITDWSNGLVESADKHIAESRRLNVEAQNSIRQLAMAIMVSGVQKRSNVK